MSCKWMGVGEYRRAEDDFSESPPYPWPRPPKYTPPTTKVDCYDYMKWFYTKVEQEGSHNRMWWRNQRDGQELLFKVGEKVKVTHSPTNDRANTLSGMGGDHISAYAWRGEWCSWMSKHVGSVFTIKSIHVLYGICFEEIDGCWPACVLEPVNKKQQPHHLRNSDYV